MPIVREYRCPECSERLGREFRFEKFHWTRDEAPPECPNALEHAQGSEPEKVPSSFGERSNISRAADITWKIAQEDYGMTDMNTKKGERAMPKTPALPPELKKQADGLFAQPGGAANLGGIKTTPDALRVAKAASADARNMGADPMKLLHEGFKKTHARGVPARVIARSNG